MLFYWIDYYFDLRLDPNHLWPHSLRRTSTSLDCFSTRDHCLTSTTKCSLYWCHNIPCRSRQPSCWLTPRSHNTLASPAPVPNVNDLQQLLCQARMSCDCEVFSTNWVSNRMHRHFCAKIIKHVSSWSTTMSWQGTTITSTSVWRWTGCVSEWTDRCVTSSFVSNLLHPATTLSTSWRRFFRSMFTLT